MGQRVGVKGGPGSGHRGHRGRPGKRGGSLPGVPTVTREYLFDSGHPGYDILHTQHLWEDPKETWNPRIPGIENTRQNIADVLVEQEVPVPFVEGTVYSNRYFDPGGWKQPLMSVADWPVETLAIHSQPGHRIETPKTLFALDPRWMNTDKRGLLVIHELGHHLSDTLPIWTEPRGEWDVSPSEALYDVFEIGLIDFDNPEEAVSLGLRPYVWTEVELAADLYVAHLLGSPEQRERLNAVFAEYYGKEAPGYDFPLPLGELFKP